MGRPLVQQMQVLHRSKNPGTRGKMSGRQMVISFRFFLILLPGDPLQDIGLFGGPVHQTAQGNKYPQQHQAAVSQGKTQSKAAARFVADPAAGKAKKQTAYRIQNHP